jgi:hypothetical protein
MFTALVLAALAGVLVQGVVAGTLLIMLLRAGIVPSGVWPVAVVAGAWIGAEITARYRVSRLAGGLVASLPVLLVTTILALHARMGELGLGGQVLVLVAVVALNGVFAFVGIWVAGVRARWAAGRRGTPVEGAAVDRTPATRERFPGPVAKTPMVRPGE